MVNFYFLDQGVKNRKFYLVPGVRNEKMYLMSHDSYEQFYLAVKGLRLHVDILSFDSDALSSSLRDDSACMLVGNRSK